MPMPGITMMAVSGAAGAFSGEFLAVDTSTSGSPHTFTGVPFGDASAGRIIVVAVGISTDTTISSVSIGGISATLAVSDVQTGVTAAIYYANVPTGTSGTVVVNASSNAAIGVYKLENATATPTNTGSRTPRDGDATLFCTVPVNGFGIVCVTDEETGSHTATNYTEQYDVTAGDGMTGGSFTETATLTCSNTTDNLGRKVLVYASWGP